VPDVNAKTALLMLLGAIALAFCVVWARELTLRKHWSWPNAFHVVVGILTDFLDTLGIGSFATTTTLYRLRRTVADENIPGTLNVGHCIPTLTQAFIYITIIEVDLLTLVLLISASVLGAWLGAGVVTRMPRRRIQIGMGLSLLVAAGFILAKIFKAQPAGSSALALTGVSLAIGLVGNFVFGALMTIGVGAYAPIMIMVSLLGMNETTAFPIMMGSCAFLMPMAGARFIQSGRYDARAALGLTLGGVPAVLVAALIVRSLDLDAVRWLVLVVVTYTAISMLWSARVESRKQAAKGDLDRKGPGSDLVL
jgi:uncharacterized membrane protein YfcA